MSVPFVEKRKLGVVNRLQTRLSQIAVRHDHQDGQRHRKNHPDGKYEPSLFWFRCHVPLLATLLVPVPVLVPRANRGRCVSYFTLHCGRLVPCSKCHTNRISEIRRLLPPSPPAEKTTARRDQIGEARTDDGSGNA